MTGFGKVTENYKNKAISVEIKSLNSKQFDLFLKLPAIFKEKEFEIRQLLSQHIERGKVECTVTVEEELPESPLKLNASIIKSYYTQIHDIAKDLNIQTTDRILSLVLKLPDSMISEQSAIDEEEWKMLENIFLQAVQAFDNFRIQEGNSLAKDISNRIGLITKYLAEIEPYEKDRIEKIRNRLNNNLADVLPQIEIDKNRLEQEIIYYLEKLDITEEKTRLTNHCKYFMQTISEPLSNGKKLNFIAQEIGREIILNRIIKIT
jgi:uncharacterized protein (TIGR00255 family)